MTDNRTLSSEAQRLIHHFGGPAGVSDTEVRVLQRAISSSPYLARQIDEAVAAGTLQSITRLGNGVHAVGEYHARPKTIKLSSAALVSPGMAAFILGHETQHAINSRAMALAYREFQQDVGRAAVTTADYSMAVENLIKANRWDESSANLAGWNALVDHVRTKRSKLWLGHVLRAVPEATLSDFVDDEGPVPHVHSDFHTDPDLGIELNTDNIDAMARRYFDKEAKFTRLGGSGTSDYANYYAAWAIGQIERPHNAVSPGQPMQIDLERIGLSRRLMEEVGIDLHGRRRQAYVDASTQPATRDFFHNTIGTFTYVPPAASDPDRSTQQAWEAVRLAAVGFARPATEATHRSLLCRPTPADRTQPTGRKVARVQRSA